MVAVGRVYFFGNCSGGDQRASPPVGAANESTKAVGALVDRVCLAGDRFEPVGFTGHLPAGPVELS